jgi:hypothetical protein
MQSHYATCVRCGEPIWDNGSGFLCDACDPCPHDRPTVLHSHKRNGRRDDETDDLAFA